MSNVERAYLERGLEVLERICIALETIADMPATRPAPIERLAHQDRERRRYAETPLPHGNLPDPRYGRDA